MGTKIKNVALVLAKEETTGFERFSFPILGRPAIKYPILASLHACEIDQVFLSTDSKQILDLFVNEEGLQLLVREHSFPTLTEEIRNAVEQIKKIFGYAPKSVTIILGNSPCILPSMLDNNIRVLEQNPSYDSVVSAMHRAEFNPNRMFTLKGNRLQRQKIANADSNVYFLDRRLMTVRTEVIEKSTIKDEDFESVLGNNIYPIIQQDGIWDIDYIWQVPIVERWLKQNGFTDAHLPYKEKAKSETPTPIVNITNAATSDKIRVLITTVPFGNIDTKPIELLNKTPNIEYVINPIGRKLKEEECEEMFKDFDVVIAGTENINRKAMENAKRLKLIARVGIGLDSVDLRSAKELGIKVAYTPDAPSAAVAELTMAHALNLMRYLPLIDRKIRSGIWQRINGERLANKVVGIVGTGRIGTRVLRHLQGFNPKKIYVNDSKPNHNLYDMFHAEHTDKETIYRECDIISLHVPLSPQTKNLITAKEFEMMKPNVVLINTSRGGIVNEQDLYDALVNKIILGAAIDVFEKEPYSGNLAELDNCLLSCHMGSMTNDCRTRMEIEATEDAIRYILGEPLLQEVPQDEYDNQL